MKININVNGTLVPVELTKEELAQALKEVKKSGNIMDRIKSFEDACEELGLDTDDVLRYDADTTDPDEINENAYLKLRTIIKALNEGWKPDFSNSSQYKYYPWLKSNGSGLGLSYFDSVCGRSCSNVGSRLYLKSGELAKYVGTQFIDIYNEYNN